MAEAVSSLDLDDRSWHDNALYGLRLDVGDHARGDWHADLVLDTTTSSSGSAASTAGSAFVSPRPL